MDASETTTVTLRWPLPNLKHLFDSSQGKSKSTVAKSPKFAGGRWQCLFYANSGTDDGEWVSLYLSCEPTLEEKESAVDAKWARNGLFDFNIELRDISGNKVLHKKEALDFSFSYKMANWGWALFARRKDVYYENDAVKEEDAFLIICTLTSPPTPISSSPS